MTTPTLPSPELEPLSSLPPPDTKAARAAERRGSWSRMKARANTISGVVVLLITILILGGAGGYLIERAHQPAAKTTTANQQTLSPADLSKLTQIGTSLGTSGQTLSIGANSLFRGQVDVGGNLSIGGQLNANGPVVLSQLNITGTTALVGLNVGSNLTVGGTTTLQKSLTVDDLTTINGGLNVSGTASINSLNAGTISVHTLSITGPILISHLQTQGVAPIATAGSAVGGGGTVSISGDDAAGTVNLNIGGSAPSGVLITVVFRAAYTATPHVLLTPLTGAAATTPVYVSRTATGFQLHVDSAPPPGTTLSYDYFVTQ